MRFLLMLSLAGFVASCARLPETGNPDVVFNQVADEFIPGYLAARPQAGTGLGLHEYDGKVSDLSDAARKEELNRLKAFRRRLEAMRGMKLGARASRDLRLLLAAIEREIFSLETLRVMQRNPMVYAGVLDVNIYVKRDFAPLPDRVKSMTQILAKAPELMAAARANLDTRLPRPQVELAIIVAEGAADFLGKDLLEALKDFNQQPLRGEFETANTRAITELRGYAAWLKKERLPKAGEDYAIGRANYVRMLAGEMVYESPERLLDIGMQELKKAQADFAALAGQIDPAAQPVAVFRAIQKDHPTEQTLIPETSRHLESIRQFLVDRQIVTLPSEVRVRVAETPQFLRATSFASMDTPGPFEKRATEAYYYVTPPEAIWPQSQKDEWLTAMNYYTTDVVSIHEAYPGHYVQFLCLNASDANRLEKIFGSYPFIEGWAHYTEQMMIEQGFGTEPAGDLKPDSITTAKYRMAQIDEALLRLCRLCVSIKMHCQGMTVDQATQFFRDNCYYEEKAARSEAMRGAYDPEYLYYTLGKLQVLKLREDYRRQEGANFSLQKFHNEMLRHGAPPIRLLREQMLKDPRLWAETL